MSISGFMARKDPHSIDMMEKFFLPQDGIVWFIESRESQKWIHDYCFGEQDFLEENLTINPLEAKSFSTEPKAIAFIIENKLGRRFIPTEHEFVK